MEDQELLQGEWSMISMEIRSVKSTDDDVKNYKLTVNGDKWVVTKGEKIIVNAVIRIDQLKAPWVIDLVQKTGGADLISPGIFKIEGDTFTMCRTGGYKDRPKEFKTTLDSSILVVWKRLTEKRG
jgi:uncharacterized protein (TIGR03067 family)